MGQAPESVTAQLQRAWQDREAAGLLPAVDTEFEAGRVFYGAGEGTGELERLSIDVFGAHAWVTTWDAVSEGALRETAQFLTEHDLRSGVMLSRPEEGVPDEPAILFGDTPTDRFAVNEQGARFYVQLFGTRHPGLFLDHAPLREWLGQHSVGRRVLNTFAYTGSLSVAAALGGADHVTAIDLSKPATNWAKENWLLNELDETMADFIAGDVFEWIPRFAKKDRRFETVIVDPPTFSRGPTGTFTTEKDLARLHELVTQVTAPGGIVVTSINSAGISRDQFRAQALEGIRAGGRAAEVMEEIALEPPGFPVRRERRGGRADYLKGLVLQLS